MQNASLVDKNAALEEEYRKVSAFRPLMDSYKTQIAELENKAASKTKDLERIRFELEQAQTRLNVLAQERAQDIEALELYQERVKELELSDPRARSRARRNTAEGGPLGEMVDVDLAEDSNLGGELDDAVTGRTTTDLKLQIRQLKRDLQDARSDSADTTKALILENLLDDANRMKSRYEADYLATHREKLLLQSQLDDIRAGKSYGDG
jgi:protein HOOK3